MAHPGPDFDGRKRRHRRQAIIVALVALLVIVAGLGAAGLYLGRLQLPARNTTPTAVPCQPARAKPLDPRKVKVNVYNATRRTGLAGRAAADLRKRRFVIGAVSNDPAKATVTGTALVRHGAMAAAAARLVAAQVPGAKVQRVTRSTPAVDLVLGAGFRSLAPVATQAPTTAPVCTPSPRTTKKKPKPATTRS